MPVPRNPCMVAMLMLAGWAAAGCSTPPDKEINQAVGAIETARAAGADAYAAEELGAAATALQKSRDAVVQRDYRLALSHAIDARERAQEAAKRAAEQRLVLHTEAETALASIAAARQSAQARLTTARNAHAAGTTLAPIEASLNGVDEAVQEARAALARGDPLGARRRLERVDEQLNGAITQIDAAIAASGPRRRP